MSADINAQGLGALVVDTNVLVSELLRSRGRRWLAQIPVTLFASERVDREFRYELERRLRAVADRGQLAPTALQQMQAEALLLYRERVSIVPAEQYAALEQDARHRIPADPDDWPSVALALLLDCGLWTEDRDFFGCGLSVWQTAVLHAFTSHQEGEEL